MDKRLAIEDKYKSQGYSIVAGFDEVGRGSIAGAMTIVGAVIPIMDLEIYNRIKDSKKMTAKQRKDVVDTILQMDHMGFAFGFGIVTANEIDKMGIINAVDLGVRRAIKSLWVFPEVAICDEGCVTKSFDKMGIVYEEHIKCEDLSLSVALASIIGKHYRDQYMINEMHVQYPEYGFNSHKGYGTQKHKEAIKQHGYIDGVHRKRFHFKSLD